MTQNGAHFERLEVIEDIVRMNLPPRSGPRPTTTSGTPHSQLDQNSPVELQHRLRDYALSLPHVRKGVSQLSVPGSVAFFLDNPPLPRQITDVFWEWGHIHPAYDGSLHINLPTAIAQQVIDLGWGEFHFVVKQGLVPPILLMLYGPRDGEELMVASRILDASYLAAGGDLRRTMS